jgi:hypothetical protein
MLRSAPVLVSDGDAGPLNAVSKRIALPLAGWTMPVLPAPWRGERGRKRRIVLQYHLHTHPVGVPAA